MDPRILYIALDDVDAECPVVGWYVQDGRDWHGEFSTKDEADAFVAYLVGEQRKEARHNRSLGYGS